MLPLVEKTVENEVEGAFAWPDRICLKCKIFLTIRLKRYNLEDLICFVPYYIINKIYCSNSIWCQIDVFLRTDAITRLCSCGPIKFVLELLASVKMEWASSSCESVSDIFCAIVEVGFNWFPSMCGALTPFWNLRKEKDIHIIL